MTTRIAATRNELREAIENRHEHIILTGALSSRFNKLEKLQELSQAQLATLIAFASGAGAAVIAGIAAAPESSGISLAFSATAVTVFAAAEGISIATVAEYLLFCALVGVKPVKYLLENYDIQFRKHDKNKKEIVELIKIDK